MGHALTLESFDDVETEEIAPLRTFEEGYEEGLQAGIAQTQAEIGALNAELVQNIGNLDFGYVEARNEIIGSLTPLLRAVVEKVLPHCVAEGFAGQLADLLMQTAEQDASAAINLHVHPGQRAAVETAVEQTATQVILHDDPSLSEHAAWIGHQRTETLLDIDGLLSAITETLGAFYQEENRTKTNG
ncbi:hypothetical protein [Yoonia sp. BS5-3]|uniref:Flagellar assembly protein FliH n=1 Tax=Yoonia phaeophyticola TaxID=3137369 RepID=A0ABZ2V661_9RHOB